MEKSKEFQGKTLDSAIKAACDYFNVPREKLEIEIVNDAKAGIFGLVGAKKARILARKTMLATVSVLSGQFAGDVQAKCGASAKEVVRESKRLEGPIEEKDLSRVQEPQPAPKKESRRTESGEAAGAGQKQRPFVRGMSKRTAYSAAKGPLRQPGPLFSSENGKETDTLGNELPTDSECPAKERSDLQESFNVGLPLEDEGEAAFEGFSIVPLEQLDAEKLRAQTLDAVQHIVAAIVRDARCVVRIEDGRVAVSVETDEDSGLLIGREGQTLSSIQYLVSRIVSKAMGAFVPLQLDAGDYRERQDEKLREMARQLARRVHETGRPHSTRPLSSYHRRVVHMALQDDAEIQTRSKGEGQLKRVILFRKPGKPGGCDCK